MSLAWLPSRIEFPGYLSREAGQRMESHCSVLCDLGQILEVCEVVLFLPSVA